MDRSFPFLLVWFIFGLCSLLTLVNGNHEGDVLNALKEKLTDPTNVLQSWDATLVNPCRWYHVTCNDENSVTRVDLGGANLSGQLVPELGQLTNLRYLELFGNKINGKIPSELGNLTQLESLDLFLNQLDGDIPTTLGKLQKLRFLRLNNNKLRGTIPSSLTTINTLQVLDLSSNLLSGFIPVNGSFKLFTNISFANNSQLIYPPSAEEDPANHLRQLKRFSLHELEVATHSFSKNNILGRGGFGNVYKGRLVDGRLVAVKRLKEEHKHGDELQFQTEVAIISLAVHRNLLRLIGFCMTPTERLLVYPYMVNGSVASWLKDRPNTKPALDWSTRKRIAVGSARGLAYLHDHCTPKIIHRDVKAANIMLDEEFEAVVGDFGLAKLLDNKATHVTTAVRGTIGHIAPEYISTGRSFRKDRRLWVWGDAFGTYHRATGL